MRMINMGHTLHPSPKNTLATILLCVGVTTFFISGWFFLNTSAALDDLENQQRQRVSKASPVKIKLNSQQLAELSAVNAAIQEIISPWPVLFNQLEKAHAESVALLSVKPDMNNKTVRIVAVTFSVDSMLAYINKLNQQNTAALVSLVSTESIALNGQDATQFELLLKW